MKKINTVYETKEYNTFSFLSNNRNVSSHHVNRIIKSMKKKRLISPITINEDGEIIDGQHRFLAQKELNMPIPYIIQKGYGEIETQLLNNNTKNLSMLVWERHYCKKNIEDYAIFRDFRKKYKFPSEQCQMLLQREANNQSFKDGLFRVICYNRAIKYADMIYDIDKYISWDCKDRMFVRSIIHIFDFGVYKHSEFIKKLSIRDNNLNICRDKKTFCREIEDVYLYKTREENRVRLF